MLWLTAATASALWYVLEGDAAADAAADAGADAQPDAAFGDCMEGGRPGVVGLLCTLSADGGMQEADSGRVTLGAWPGV